MEDSNPNVFMTEAEEGHSFKRGALFGAIGGACVDGLIDVFALKGDLSPRDFAINGFIVLVGVITGITVDHDISNERARRAQNIQDS